jgi:hypothetical protein
LGQYRTWGRSPLQPCSSSFLHDPIQADQPKDPDPTLSNAGMKPGQTDYLPYVCCWIPMCHFRMW